MLCTVEKVAEIMEGIAPKDYAEAWDNVGLLLGDPKSLVRRIMVVLDVTPDIIDEAKSKEVDMIIAHHPIIFSPLKRVVGIDTEGRLIMDILSEGISVFCAHTNLDMAQGGIDDSLADTLGLKNVELLNPSYSERDRKPGFGRWGALESSISLGEFGEYLRPRFPGANIEIIGDENKQIKRVALCGGSGAGFIDSAIRVGADIFITGEIKYHETLKAQMEGMDLVTLGHYHSEMPGVNSLTRRLQNTMDSLQYKVELIGSEIRKHPYPGIFIN